MTYKKEMVRSVLWIHTVSLFIMIILSLASSAQGAWTAWTVDAPKAFSNFYSRSIAIDGSGNPHIAYGEDHLYHAYHDGSSWNYETVDSSSGAGQYASVALDSSGKVHIGYYDWTNGDLKYATNASGSWVTTTIDSFADVGVTASIAVDSSDKVHISYYDWDNFYLKYATNASGSWVLTTVDSSADVGLYSSIALDSSNKAHISYYDYDNDHLKYATNASGSWVNEIADGSVSTGMYTSIAVDTSDRAHISYHDWGSGDLKYATNASGSWAAGIVDSAGTTGLYSSIAIDPSGDFHISYYDDTADDLKYATNSGVSPGAGNCANTDWNCDAVDTAGVAGMYTSIATDPSGNVHISYYNSSYDVLKYATNATGSWIGETVDSSGDAGEYSSIATDSAGNLHISYYDNNAGDLKYATNAMGSWVTAIVDSLGIVGRYSSISIDSSDYVHISYYYSSGGDLRYATNRNVTPGSGNCSNTDWNCETVDGLSAWVGSYTSIVVDSTDNLHISYYDGTNGNLKYATNASGSWVTEKVDGIDGVDDVGWYTSITMDLSDNVHISYYDWDNSDLKYATNTAGSWAAETVDGTGDVGLHTSIATDSSNNIHISYYKLSQGNLRYASGVSGSWSKSTVDSTGDTGLFSSIAIDSSDNAHISYYDYDNADLKYATNVSGSWADETVDSGGDAGQYTSIVMDSWDNVHISYYDFNNGDLEYATNAQMHTLAINKGGTGGGTVTSSPGGIGCGTDCSQDYISSTIVILTPDPDPGSVFTAWSGDPDCFDGVVTMDSGKTCTAAFDLQTFTLTVSKAGTCSELVTSSPQGIDCGADCSEDYSNGTLVTVTASEADDCRFVTWTGCDSPSGNVCTLTMNADKSVTASYVRRHSLETFISPEAAGVLVPDCSAGCGYDIGTIVTLTATANSGYEFDYWTGCDLFADHICTMTMDTDENVTAVFYACMDPVRIEGETADYYTYLQDALSGASADEVVESRIYSFSETIFYNNPASITLKVGYDCDYSNITGVTSVEGNLTINDGSITIGDGILIIT